MKNPKPNLSKREQKVMEELAKRKDVIVINAKKCDAVAIMAVEKYISTKPTTNYLNIPPRSHVLLNFICNFW